MRFPRVRLCLCRAASSGIVLWTWLLKGLADTGSAGLGSCSCLPASLPTRPHVRLLTRLPRPLLHPAPTSACCPRMHTSSSADTASFARHLLHLICGCGQLPPCPVAPLPPSPCPHMGAMPTDEERGGQSFAGVSKPSAAKRSEGAAEGEPRMRGADLSCWAPPRPAGHPVHPCRPGHPLHATAAVPACSRQPNCRVCAFKSLRLQ